MTIKPPRTLRKFRICPQNAVKNKETESIYGFAGLDWRRFHLRENKAGRYA